MLEQGVPLFRFNKPKKHKVFASVPNGTLGFVRHSVSVKGRFGTLIPSSMGHVKSRVNRRGPPRKAKYSWVTDSEKYREGKVKKNPCWGVKENMKP